MNTFIFLFGKHLLVSTVFYWIFSIGCDSVIDKSTQDLWTTASDLTVNGYKAIFDANGIETLQQSYAHLAKGGRLVTYGESKTVDT